MTSDEKNEGKTCGKKLCGNCAGLMWWATLTIAVLAVPTIGIYSALTLARTEVGQVMVFVLACWLSVWLGMWLVRKADTHNAKKD